MKRQINAATGRIDSGNDDLYVFDFSIEGASLDRQGDDLAMRLSDGREIVFGNFYRAKRASFIIEDQEFSARDFFAALDAERLAPAMGPAQGSAQDAGSGQSAHHSWESMSSMEGTWHLDGLDISGDAAKESFAARMANLGEAPAGPIVYNPEFPKSVFADEAVPDKPAIIEIPSGFTVASVVCKGPGHVGQLSDGTWAYYPAPVDSGRIPGRNDVEGADEVTVTVTDPSGVTHVVKIPITIRDDVPEANPDSADVFEDAMPHAAGNVLDNDSFGADGPGGVEWLDKAGKYGKFSLNPDGSWEYELDNSEAQHLIAGETLTEEIRYRITDSDGDASESVLAITIRGADDGVIIEPENPEPVDPDIPVIPASDYDAEIPAGASPSVLTVSEADLKGGNARASDSMLIRAPDGLSEISVNGAVVWKDGKLTGREIATDEGRLVIDGFDPAEGRLSYTFILDRATREHSAEGRDQIAHNFRVTARDRDGSEGESRIQLRVADDIPEANDDGAAVTEGTLAPISGNVLLNDDSGADGFGGTIRWEGEAKYGELVLRPDGSWEYRLDGRNPEVKALPEGGTLTETIRYAITDADGDAGEAMLTITINGSDNGVVITPGNPVGDSARDFAAEGAKVLESRLPGESASGHVDIDAPDGVSRVEIGGVAIWENGSLAESPIVSSDVGELRVLGFDPESGRLTYEYVLKESTREHAERGNDSVFHRLGLLVVDTDGTRAESAIIIEIMDDVPVSGKIEAIGLSGENVVSGSTLSGSFAVDFGADGPADTPFVIDGAEYSAAGDGSHVFVMKNVPGVPDGTLVIRERDGDWSYEFEPDIPNAWFNPALVAIRAIDADGDETLVNLFVSLDHETRLIAENEGEPEYIDGKLVLGRPEIDEGKQPEHGGTIHEKAEGHFTAVLNGEKGVIGIAGGARILIDPAAGEPAVIESGEAALSGVILRVLDVFEAQPGKWRVDYEISCEGGAGWNHPGWNLPVGFDVTVTGEGENDTVRGVIAASLHDDAPIAVDDENAVSEDEASIAGFVLTNDLPGRDGFAENSVFLPEGREENGEWVLKGLYGTLAMRKDGSYEYFLDNANPEVRRLSEGGELRDAFGYSYQDGDGDAASARLDITINGRDNAVSFTESVSETGVDEAGLADGAVLSESRQIRISAPDGLKSAAIDGVEIFRGGEFVGGEIISDEGRLVADSLVPDPDNPDGYILAWHFILDRATQEHGQEGRDESFSHEFTLSVSDWDDTPASLPLRVEIIDDAPVISGTDSIGLTGPTVKSGATLSGIFMLDAGADGVAGFEIDGVAVVKDGESWVASGGSLPAGRLILTRAEGEGWNYVFEPGTGDTILGDFTLAAIDGDGDRTETLIHLERDMKPAINDSMDDDVRVAEAATNEGVNPHDGARRPSSGGFSFMASLNGGDGVIEVGGLAVAVEGGEAQLPVDVAEQDGVALRVLSAEPVGGQWKISCEWDYDQSQEGRIHAGNELPVRFGITVRDDNGDEAKGHVVVNIHDDAPAAVSDIREVNENATIGGSVLDNDAYHADGQGVFVDGRVVRWDAEGGREEDADGRGYVDVDAAEGLAKLYDDGSYEYFAKPHPDFAEGDSFHVSFGYSIIDADGDEARSSLEIDVKPDGRVPRLSDGENAAVDEALLAEGGSGDRDHPLSGHGETKVSFGGESGTVSFFEGDREFASFDLAAEGGETALSGSHQLGNGVKITFEKAVFENGDWKIAYSYQLSDPQGHSGENAVGSDDSLDAIIAVKAVDATGDASETKITIGVHDDGPKFGEEDILSFGADGMAAVPFTIEGIEPEETDGKYVFALPAKGGRPGGTLTLEYAGGKISYSFEADDANLNYDGGFILTAIDADGDSARTSFPVNRHLPPMIGTDEGELQADAKASEFAVDEGKQPYHDGEHGNSGVKTVTINLRGQDGVIEIGGIRVEISNGEAVFNPADTAGAGGAEISVVSAGLNADGRWEIGYSYRYADAGGQLHSGENGDNLPGSIGITVTAPDGQTAGGYIGVAIHDDIADATDDSHAIDEGETLVSGNVLDNDGFGADGNGGMAWLGLLDGDGEIARAPAGSALQGLYGVFTLTDDGGWMYELNGRHHAVMSLKDGESLVEKVSYMITDGDGDADAAELAITINGKSHEITVTPGDPDAFGNAHIDVDEAVLANGTDPRHRDIIYGSIDVETADGIARIHARFMESDPVVLYTDGGAMKADAGGEEEWEDETRWIGWQRVDTESGILYLRYEGGETSGKIVYAFEFNQKIAHPGGADRNVAAESVLFTVTNLEGTEKTGRIDIDIRDDMPVLKEVTSDGLSGKISMMFGADGMHAQRAFVLLDQDAGGNFIEIPAKAGSGWEFRVDENAAHPAGILKITGYSGDYGWTFTPDDPNLDFNGKFTIAATDSDNDRITFEIGPSADFEPEFVGHQGGVPLDRSVLDEGLQPEGESHETHDPAGTFSFAVNLHGKDGVLKVGDGLEISLAGGEAHGAGKSVINGVEAAFSRATLVDGVWRVELSWSYDQSGQGRDHSESDLSLDVDFPLLITDSDGYSTESFLRAEIHDDAPVFGEDFTVEANVSEDGCVLIDDHNPVVNGKIAFSIGADLEGAKVVVTIGEAVYEGSVADGVLSFPEGSGFILDLDGNFSWRRPAGDLIATGDTYEINVKLTDSDGDELEKTYTVNTYAGPSLEGEEETVNGVPVFRVPGALMDEQNLGRLDADGNPLSIQTKTFLMSTHSEGGKLEITYGDQVIWAEVDERDNMTAISENPVIETGYGRFTLSDIRSGQATWRYELTRSHSEGDANDGRDTDLIESLDLKITDNRNSDVTLGRLDISLVDDMPAKPQVGEIISGKIYSENLDAVFYDPDGFGRNIQDGQFLNPLTYFSGLNAQGEDVQEWVKVTGWGSGAAASSLAGGKINSARAGCLAADIDGGLRVIATSAFLFYEKDGSSYAFSSMQDVNTGKYADEILKRTDTADYDIFDKNLYLTSKGLVVGGPASVWSSGKLTNANYVWNENETGLRGRTGYEGHVLSEAMVLENMTDTIAYNFNAEFGSIQSGDRIMISFMMTPKNSNDNLIVKVVEIDPNDYGIVDGTIRIDIPVPQGFTKTLIAAAPSVEDLEKGGGKIERNADNHNSGFTLQSVSFGKETWQTSGSFVDIDFGADGPADADAFSWDLNDNDWDHVTIETQSVPYTYKVIITSDGNGGYRGVLSGSGKLNGKLAFVATLSEEGDWNLIQYYNMKFGNNAESINVRFSVRDSDGDITGIVRQIGLPEAKLDRFDLVLTGYQDSSWYDPAALDDKARDIIAGTNGNDLIYAKGDDDFVLGDGGAEGMRALLKELNFTDYSTDSIIMKHVDVDNTNKTNQTSSGSSGNRLKAQEYLWDVFNEKGIAQNGNTGFSHDGMNDLLARFEREHPEMGGDDAIFGGKGDDILIGLGGDDFIDGGGGTDVIYAGGGNDIIIWDGNDVVVHGGAGIDILISENRFTVSEAVSANATDVEIALSGRNITWLTTWDALNQKGLSVRDGRFIIDGDHWTTENGEQFTHITDGYFLDLKDGLDYGVALRNLGQAGSFDIREADALSGELACEGYEIVSVIAQGAIGKAEKVDGKWVYTLGESWSHEPVQGANTAYGIDQVTLMLRDPSGRLYEAKFGINAVDDTPDISVGIPEMAITSGDKAEIPISVKYGADDGEGKSLWLTWIDDESEIRRAEVVPGFSHETPFGTLTIDPEAGHAMFSAKPNVSGSLHFGLEAHDADGDVKTLDGALNIVIEKPAAPMPDNFAISENDGEGAISVPGWSVSSFSGTENLPGSFVSDSGGGWKFVISDYSAITPGSDISFTVNATVRDGFENEWEIPLTVRLIESAPVISIENESEGIFTGGVHAIGRLGIDWGRDGAGSLTLVTEDGQEIGLEAGKQIALRQGNLVLGDDGTLRLFSAPLGADAESGELSFIIRAVDGDGSRTEREVSVALLKPVPEIPDLSIGENDDGLQVSLAGGWSIVSADAGTYGKLGLIDGNWFYRLDGPIAHAGGIAQDELSVLVRDGLENYRRISLKIDIVDSGPELDLSEIRESAVAPGQEVLIGRVSADYRADGPGRLEIGLPDGTRVEAVPDEPLDTGKGLLTITAGGEILFRASDTDDPDKIWLKVIAADSDGSEKALDLAISIESSRMTWDEKGENGAEGTDAGEILFSGDVTAAEIARAIGVESYGSSAEIMEILRTDSGALAKAIECVSGRDGTFANVSGGYGDDIIIGQNGGEAVFGDAFMKDDLNGVIGGNSSSIGATLRMMQDCAEGEPERLDRMAASVEAAEKDLDSPNDGNDIVYALDGADLVYGGGGNDFIDGGEGNGMLFGGSGNDEIYGGSDQDFIFGGSGDDFIDGRGGNDWLFGGSGNDIIVWSAGDHVLAGEGIDIVLSESAIDNPDSFIQEAEIVISGWNGERDLAELGISLSDGALSLDENWTRTDEGKFSHKSGMRLETALENVGGGFMENTEDTLDDLVGAAGGTAKREIQLAPDAPESGDMVMESAMRYVEDNQG